LGLGYPSNNKSRRVISIVACCHSVKLYALTARAFRAQEYHPCHLINSTNRFRLMAK